MTAPNPCDICGCIPGNVGNEVFKQAVLALLCQLAEGGVVASQNLSEVGGVAITLGQKAMVASLPVVLASNQSSIPVTATLAAETTKVIGTVNQGTSPWVVSGTSTVSGTVAVTQSTSPWVVAATLTAETTKVIGTVNQGTSPWVTSVTSSVPGTGATNLGKAEDLASVSGDTGVFMLGIRNDTPGTTFTSNDADYGQISTNKYGCIYVTLDPRTDAAGISPMRRQGASGASFSGGDGVMMSGAEAQTTPSSDAADGKVSTIKTNLLGATYIESANQLATYAASITAGASGGIPTTGVSVLTNSAKIKILSVVNTTDVAILISPDAGTTYPYYVAATNGSVVIDLGANGRWAAANISAKSITSNSTSGSLYVGATI